MGGRGDFLKISTIYKIYLLKVTPVQFSANNEINYLTTNNLTTKFRTYSFFLPLQSEISKTSRTFPKCMFISLKNQQQQQKNAHADFF